MTRAWHTWSPRTLVGAAMLLVQIVAVVVLSVPVLRGRDTIIYEQARRMATARARLCAAILERDLSPPAVDRTLRALLTSQDIVEARLVRPGQVLGRIAGRDSTRGLAVTVPLQGAEAGTQLELELSTDQLEGQLAAVTIQMVVLLAVVLGGGIAAAYSLSRMLAASQAELREANATLEQRVEERTRQLIETQEQLVEAERLITVGDMSAQVAHDVRNPLAALSVNVELLSDEVADCACAQRAARPIEAIRRSLIRTNAALGEYLEFAGLTRARLAPGDANATLAAELESLRDWLQGKNVTTVLALGERVPPVRLEPRRFRFAVRAVVRHAVDAMLAGGTLTVATMTRNGCVQVRISDTGSPIAEERVPELFKLFCGLRPNSGGPGLGLAREILKTHNGTLDLERTDTAGSTFLLELPAAPAA